MEVTPNGIKHADTIELSSASEADWEELGWPERVHEDSVYSWPY